jgi:hypothetical protein
MKRQILIGLTLLTLFCLAVAPAIAEVTHFEVKSRTNVPGFGYEKVVGRLHFAVDRRQSANAIIVDIDKAPRGAEGRVTFSADFYMLKPMSGGNSAALVDIVNRGRLTFGRFTPPTAR